MMFWLKKTIESEEFRRLFNMFENLRIEVESLKLDVNLYKNKLSKRAGIKTKEEEDEVKDPKDPYNGVLLPTSFSGK